MHKTVNQGKHIFIRLTDLLSQRVLDRLVKKYDGNKQVIFFSCRHQLSCMFFVQHPVVYHLVCL